MDIVLDFLPYLVLFLADPENAEIITTVFGASAAGIITLVSTSLRGYIWKRRWKSLSNIVISQYDELEELGEQLNVEMFKGSEAAPSVDSKSTVQKEMPLSKKVEP